MTPTCPARLPKPHFNVTAFKGKDDVLSNFYPCKVHVHGKTFHSSEHAYQYMKAMKNDRAEVAERIVQLDCARQVKFLSHQIKTNQAWQDTKQDTMRVIIEAKSRDVPEYRSALLNSAEVIAEAVPGDTYWSCGLSKSDVIWTRRSRWPGRNVMGELHMELRERLTRDTDKVRDSAYFNIAHLEFLFSKSLCCCCC